MRGNYYCTVIYRDKGTPPGHTDQESEDFKNMCPCSHFTALETLLGPGSLPGALPGAELSSSALTWEPA